MSKAINALVEGFFNPTFWKGVGEMGFLFFCFAVLMALVFASSLIGSIIMEKWF